MIRHSAGKGFSLLEILAAVSIIAIVFISVFKLHCQTISMSSDTTFFTTAPLLAQSKLAAYDAISSDEWSDSAGDYGDKFPEFSWEVTIDDVESEALGKDFKKIDVLVSYRNGENTYMLRTYRLVQE